MPTSANSVKLNELFCDALSGEFYPLSHPSRQSQTLGRLAITTTKEGALIDANAKLVKYQFTLPWAQNVRTLVTCMNDKNGSSHSLTLVELETDENQLAFRDGKDDLGLGSGVSVNRDSGAEYFWLPNNRGGDLIKATSRIADMAQKFLDLANTSET